VGGTGTLADTHPGGVPAASGIPSNNEEFWTRELEELPARYWSSPDPAAVCPISTIRIVRHALARITSVAYNVIKTHEV
jgi:hypothetical protein